MCGIFGAIGKWDRKDLRFLALLNQSRGNHAAGVVVGTKYVKGAFSMEELLASPKANEVFYNKARFIMGHTRWATHGKKDDDNNAHPFFKDKICGIHNGVIDNLEELKTKLGKKFEVDSEYIFESLNQQPDINEALCECVGYWGLAWINSDTPDKLFLSKHENVLAMYKTPTCVYFSSDSDHLRICFGIGKDEVEEIEENTILAIDVNTLEIEKTPLTKLKKRFTAKDARTNGCGNNTRIPFRDNTTSTDRTEQCQGCYEEVDVIDLEPNLLAEGYCVCNECCQGYFVNGRDQTTACFDNWDEALDSMKEMIEADTVIDIITKLKGNSEALALPFTGDDTAVTNANLS